MERHGSQTARAGRPAQFRFSYMFPRSPEQLSEPHLERLGARMAAGTGTGLESSDVPAGYTYLAQFVAHDLSFDRTRGHDGPFASAELVQARSPALDLDSLYGAGPRRSRRLYADDGVALALGATLPGAREGRLRGLDLPRGRGGRALIADERNEDNLAVAQTHLAFIRFHNRVAREHAGPGEPRQRFARARELVTKHYQWLIRHDLLPRICAPAVLDDVFANGRRVFEVGAPPEGPATMPLEFSAAAFRVGHSMVREFYSWNRVRPRIQLAVLFDHTARAGRLTERLRRDMVPDWRRLHDFAPVGHGSDELTTALRIDTRLAPSLARLPDATFGGPDLPRSDPGANLAVRNLIRGRRLELVSGQEAARLLAERGVPVQPLATDLLREGPSGFNPRPPRRRPPDDTVAHTPLWFYVLREAEHNGGRLAGVGAQIVAETFHRAIEASRHSIVRDAGWQPSLGRAAGRFDMVDLLLYGYEGDLGLLAPLER